MRISSSGDTILRITVIMQKPLNSRSNDSYAWMGYYNVNRSYATNGLNQLSSAGATALGYDDRGNLTASGSNAYGYTAENRMVAAPNGVSIGYDPTGRISQLTQGANITKFEHLGPRMIAERNAGGGILRRYVHGPGDDEPVVWYDGAGTSSMAYDAQGRMTSKTNRADDHYYYDITGIVNAIRENGGRRALVRLEVTRLTASAAILHIWRL